MTMTTPTKRTGTTTNYGVSYGDGSQITNGLPEHTTRATAQRMADDRGESVWLWRDGQPDGDDGEEFAPQSQEAGVEILTGTPNGNVVEYDADASAESVESAAGSEWRVDWDTTPVRLTSGRFRSPIFRRVGGDPDAQCPTHGCARWRCDADHPAAV